MVIVVVRLVIVRDWIGLVKFCSEWYRSYEVW